MKGVRGGGGKGVFFLLFLLARSVSTSPLETFLEWFHQAGGRFSPSVAVIDDSHTCERILSATSDSRGGVRVVTKNRLPRDSIIVATPLDLLLRPANKSVCTSCDQHELLALRLLHEVSEGTRSPWSPYVLFLLGIDEKKIGWKSGRRTSTSLKKGNGREIDSIASAIATADEENAIYTAASGSNAALDFTSSELDLLTGTYAGLLVASSRRRVRRFLFRVKSEPQGTPFSDSALQWAMGVVLSRSLTVVPSSVHQNNLDSLSSSFYNVPFLAPGCDVLNHSPVVNVGWTLNAIDSTGSANTYLTSWKSRNTNGIVGEDHQQTPTKRISDKMFAIVALEPYSRAGLEVFNSYHSAASNAHLLANYGYTPSESNPHDGIALSFPLIMSQVTSSLSSDVRPPLFPSVLLSTISTFQKELEAHSRQINDSSSAETMAIEHLFESNSSKLMEIEEHRSMLFDSIKLATGTLKRRGSGPLSHVLLNVARLAAISSPEVIEWLDMYAQQFQGKGLYSKRNSEYVPFVLVPTSANNELFETEEALKENLRELSHLSLLRFFPADRVSKFVPVYDSDQIDVSPTGDFQSTRLVTRHANVQFPLSFSTFLDGRVFLNNSVLTDLYALRFLHSSLTNLLRQYPGGADIETDSQVLTGLIHELRSVIDICEGASTQHVDGVMKKNNARAAASASSLSAANLTFISIETRNRVKMLKRRINIYHIRIDEMRIIHDNLMLIKSMIDDLSSLLLEHRVSPLGKQSKEDMFVESYLPDTNSLLKDSAWLNLFFGNTEEQENQDDDVLNLKVSSTLDEKTNKSFNLRGSEQQIETKDTDSVRVDHDDHEHSIDT
jgi:hypothetical protein